MSDYDFGLLIPMDVSNPFLVDSWLQRLVLMTELVSGTRLVPGDVPEGHMVTLKTVGDRTVEVRKDKGVCCLSVLL